MVSRRWCWLIAALCCPIGVGCGHSRCSQSAKPATLQAANAAAPPKVLTDSSTTARDKSIMPVPTFDIKVPEVPQILDSKIVSAPPAESESLQIAPQVVETPKAPAKPAVGCDRFSHPLDFAWVVGQLQYSHASKQWRIRYLPCETDDEFGGILTITGAELLVDQFVDGAAVRLQGQLVDPDVHKAAPEYFTWGITVLK